MKQLQNRQVITIRPDGQVEGLQRKPGQGLDLRKLGNASITRASEIVWSDREQKWFVHILSGRFAGKTLTYGLWINVVGARPPAGRDKLVNTDRILFEEYDDAVKAEIAFLDAARLRGRL